MIVFLIRVLGIQDPPREFAGEDGPQWEKEEELTSMTLFSKENLAPEGLCRQLSRASDRMCGGQMTQERNPLQPPASMLIKLMELQHHPGENGEKKPRNNRKYVSDHQVE